MAEHVPTAHELVKMGLATERVRMIPQPKGKKDRREITYVISDEGHALMGEVMRRNAQEKIDSGEAAWVQPPSRRLGD